MLHTLLVTVLLIFKTAAALTPTEDCIDKDKNCQDWVTTDAGLCRIADYIVKSCPRSCGVCIGKIPPKFDISRIPRLLQPIAWLVGIWHSDHGGKAIFPTIPKFTYGEHIEISLADSHISSLPALNYTAFAWSLNDHEELHSEYGYLTIQPGSNIVSLTTVMDNGFVTVEQGQIEPNRIEFHLFDIGRISFSRDLPVHALVREWTLLDKNTLQARLNMETLTHGMQEHTFIRYHRVNP